MTEVQARAGKLTAGRSTYSARYPHQAHWTIKVSYRSVSGLMIESSAPRVFGSAATGARGSTHKSRRTPENRDQWLFVETIVEQICQFAFGCGILVAA